MSIISHTHDFKPYDAKSSKPVADQRLEVVRYKNTKKQPAKFRNICVSVPPVQNPNSKQLDQMMPHIRNLLEHAQHGIIQDLHEAGKSAVTTAEISIESCIVYLDAEAAGDRLSKERVAEWFDSEVSEVLQVLFAEKLGFSDTPSEDQMKKLEKIVGSYKEKFESLAGGRTNFDPDTAKSLFTALEKSEVRDDLALKFGARLKKMQEQPKVDLLAL